MTPTFKKNTKRFGLARTRPAVEGTKMPKLSKSEVKAAISKILARKEAHPPIQPRRLALPNLGKRLASVFADDRHL